MNLEGSTALVTGGAVRIGRAICKALAARGCSVVIHFNRSASEAEELKKELIHTGVDAHTVRGAIESPTGCEQIISDAWTISDGFNILVNNAAIFEKQDFLDTSTADFEKMWRINALGPILMTRAFAERLGSGGEGLVVNLLDRRVAGNETGCMPYLLSKKTLADFTSNAALELAPAIRVNAVAPGAVLPPPRSSASIVDLAGRVPLDCRCQPEDVADAVVFLAHANTVTGQVLFVDGGQHLCS